MCRNSWSNKCACRLGLWTWDRGDGMGVGVGGVTVLSLPSPLSLPRESSQLAHDHLRPTQNLQERRPRGPNAQNTLWVGHS